MAVYLRSHEALPILPGVVRGGGATGRSRRAAAARRTGVLPPFFLLPPSSFLPSSSSTHQCLRNARPLRLLAHDSSGGGGAGDRLLDATAGEVGAVEEAHKQGHHHDAWRAAVDLDLAEDAGPRVPVFVLQAAAAGSVLPSAQHAPETVAPLVVVDLLLLRRRKEK